MVYAVGVISLIQLRVKGKSGSVQQRIQKATPSIRKFYNRLIAVLLILQSSFGYTEPLSGKQLAFDRNKGNCLACHVIEDGESPGDIGPPLRSIRSRFKDKQQLRAHIWDATQFNSETSMPPFGKNKILSAKEIDAIVDYLWKLP